MFWETNNPPAHSIEILLESPDTKVELFLEKEDIIQECKSLKKNLVNYFTRPDVIRRMIELITTEPPEETPMNQRFFHANVACEILTMGLPSLEEKLLAETDTLNMFYSYLENEPPLNPLLASFFSKTFSMLFTKKVDQDWFLYQQTCLKLLEYLKTKNNFLDLICKHFTTPIVPDLIMEIMQNVESEVKRILFEWLNEERLVEKLIGIIGDPEQSEKHASVADFLCDLIHQGRTMRQDTESFEPVFGGSDPILQKIESATTLLALFNVILQPNTVESAVVSGITVVLKIIKPTIVTDERNIERMFFSQGREEEIHSEFLTTVIRVIEPQIKHFNELLKTPPKKSDLVTSAATLSPPFGMARLQIVRLFTELFNTKNNEIYKAISETDFLDILLALFKEYCWNNFLHSEVEKCLHSIFPYSNTPPAKEEDLASVKAIPGIEFNSDIDFDWLKQPKVPAGTQSDIQIHAIVNCQIISKLIECWKMNKENESAEKGRRLGFMGHLIKIFKHITKCISESEHIGALIENNLKDDSERDLWQSIVNTTDGELTIALTAQSKLLANHEPCEYNVSLDFFTENNISDAFTDLCSLVDSSDAFGRSNDDDEDDNAAAPFDTERWRNDEVLNELLDRSVAPTVINTPKNEYQRDYNELFSTSSEEYDNNANVEKSTSWSGDFTSFQIPKNDTQFTRNFVDDYEDDEGMWTKPLVPSTSSLLFDNFDTDPFGLFVQAHGFEANFTTNGPSLLEEGERASEESAPNQLNNSNEDNASVDQTPADITSSEIKTDESMKEINSEETTSKHKSNTPDTNEIETKTENTTTNTPTTQPTNTAIIADELTDVSTTAANTAT